MAVTPLTTGYVGPAQNPVLTLNSVPSGQTLLVFVSGPVTISHDSGASTSGWVRDYYSVNQTGGAVFRLPTANNPGGTVTLALLTNGNRYVTYVAITGDVALPQYGNISERGVISGTVGTGLHTFSQQAHVFAMFPLVDISAPHISTDIASYDQSFTEVGDSGITPDHINEEMRLWVAYKADTAMANSGVTGTLASAGSGIGMMGLVAYSAQASNSSPIVNAGSNQAINLGDSTTITATASDGDGTIVSTLWAASNGGPTPDNPTNLSTTVGPFTSVGSFIYTFSATDDDSATANDTLVISVTDPAASQEALYDSVGLTVNSSATDGQGLNLYTKFFVANPVTLNALRYFRPTGATGTYTLSLWTGTNATPIITTTDSSGTPNSWVTLDVTDTALPIGWYILGEFVPAGQPYTVFNDGHPDSPNTTSPSKSLWTMSGVLTTPLNARPVAFNYGPSPAFIDYPSLESFDPPQQHCTYGIQPIVTPENNWEPPIFWTAPPAGQFNNSGPLTVGQRIRPEFNGVITGIAYWRGLTGGSSDTATVTLYDSVGNLLRQKVASAESAYGWNRLDFDTPISVQAGDTYTVAYFSPGGFYAASIGALGSIVNGPQYDLLASGGKFSTASSASYPTNDAGNNSYYYVDPIFLTSAGSIPSVNAGTDQSAETGDTITLTGVVTDNGTITSYLWSQLSGPTLAPTTPTQISTQVGPFTQAGTYVYRLSATDDEGLTGEDSVVVTVTESGAPITYRAWSITDAPNPAHFVLNEGALNFGLWFTVQEEGQSLYRFWAYYRQEMGALNWRLYSTTGVVLATATLSASSTTGWRSVDVDGGPYELTNGTTYMAAFKESPDTGSFFGSINYYPGTKSTTYDAGPFRLGAASQGVNTSPNTFLYGAVASMPSNTAADGRNYWLDVEIGSMASGQTYANAGPNQTVVTGDTVTLNGSASLGDNLSYDWQQSSGTSVTLNGSGASRTFTAPASGPLVFELTVTDTVSLDTSSDTVTINIAGNKVAAENILTGNSSAEWYGFTGVGSRNVLGYAYPFNPNVGTTVEFRVDGNADELKLYRLGWYGGAGARLVETLAVTPIDQPNPLNIPDLQGGSTCYEAANWTTNATWAIPADATSGVYLGICHNTGTGEKSYLRFVVTDHARPADIVVTTADATWQAYNFYGPGTSDGGCVYGPDRSFGITTRCFGWSYRRPIVHREARVNDLYNSEVAFIRFLERNGYDVKYVSHVDLDAGNGLSNAQIFMSSGHDEYWSEPARDLVQAHVASGKHAIFSSGNEVFWRTERHPTNPDWFYCRKDTMGGPGAHVAGTLIGPTWTGTWRDTRWVGRQPENLLTGTTFRMNGIFDRTFSVDASVYSSSPFWRNTTVAQGTNLSVGGIIGFEADDYEPPVDATAVRLSTTVIDISGSRADDNGENYGGSGNLDHGLVLFQRAGQGVTLGMGTCQWSWGLDDFHDRGGSFSNNAIKQSTINILSDMGAQPSYVEHGLTMPTPVSWAAYGLSATETGVYDASGTELRPMMKKGDGSVVEVDFTIKD